MNVSVGPQLCGPSDNQALTRSHNHASLVSYEEGTAFGA